MPYTARRTMKMYYVYSPCVPAGHLSLTLLLGDGETQREEDEWIWPKSVASR